MAEKFENPLNDPPIGSWLGGTAGALALGAVGNKAVKRLLKDGEPERALRATERAHKEGSRMWNATNSVMGDTPESRELLRNYLIGLREDAKLLDKVSTGTTAHITGTLPGLALGAGGGMYLGDEAQHGSAGTVLGGLMGLGLGGAAGKSLRGKGAGKSLSADVVRPMAGDSTIDVNNIIAQAGGGLAGGGLGSFLGSYADPLIPSTSKKGKKNDAK